MDAYRVPLVASVLAAVAVAASLGAVRIGRWWRSMMSARTGTWVPRPGIAPETVDLMLPRLAYRALTALLLVGATALLLFTGADPLATARPRPLLPLAAAVGLAIAWWPARKWR